MKKQASLQQSEEMGTAASQIGKKDDESRDITGTLSTNLAAAFIPDDPDDADDIHFNTVDAENLNTTWMAPTATGLSHSEALLDFS